MERECQKAREWEKSKQKGDSYIWHSCHSWTHCSCGSSAQDWPPTVYDGLGRRPLKPHASPRDYWQSTVISFSGVISPTVSWAMDSWLGLQNQAQFLSWTACLTSDTNKLQYRKLSGHATSLIPALEDRGRLPGKTTYETLSQSKFYYEKMNLVSKSEILVKKRFVFNVQIYIQNTFLAVWKLIHRIQTISSKWINGIENFTQRLPGFKIKVLPGLNPMKSMSVTKVAGFVGIQPGQDEPSTTRHAHQLLRAWQTLTVIH